jgi:septal ring factor EnvC (AmiA/AmiB activator)
MYADRMVGLLSVVKAIYESMSTKRIYLSFFTFSLLGVFCFNTVYGLVPIENEKKNFGVILVNNLNFRPQPGLNGAPMGVLKKGSTVKIIGKRDGWLKIEHKGQTGYISSNPRYVRVLMKMDKDGETAESIDRKIQAAKAELNLFAKRESELISSLYDIDHILNIAQKSILYFKGELDELEEELKKSELEFKTLTAKVQTVEAYAQKRLVALYKLSNLGQMPMLASAKSLNEVLQLKTALERILAYDENILTELMENQARLEQIVQLKKAKMEEKLALEAKYRKEIEAISKKKAQREKLLAYIRNKKSLELITIKALKKAAATLNTTIDSLKDTTEAEPSNQKVSSGNFPALKGLLKLPVKGKIITRFGAYKNTEFNIRNFRSGIDIRADKGEPIRAVYDGKVLYASWFKGYGNMIIIDHGKNFYTVYAHIEELFKGKGDTVETGEVVATVGDSDSLIGPELYFEIRHHGKPMDPLNWLAAG